VESNLKIRKTEKAAVNIGVVELAQIDVLVENLLYTNRSDFIRTAIRKQLEYHQDYIGKIFAQSTEQNEKAMVVTIGGIGVFRLSANDLQRLKSQGKKASVIVVGVLIIDRSIDADMFSAQVASIKIYGRLQATKQLQEILAQKRMKYEA
jgi:Arc/MetJ-type ribon-helix-helix transcriptional regulator